jgi:hypothetical protein
LPCLPPAVAPAEPAALQGRERWVGREPDNPENGRATSHHGARAARPQQPAQAEQGSRAGRRQPGWREPRARRSPKEKQVPSQPGAGSFPGGRRPRVPNRAGSDLEPRGLSHGEPHSPRSPCGERPLPLGPNGWLVPWLPQSRACPWHRDRGPPSGRAKRGAPARLGTNRSTKRRAAKRTGSPGTALLTPGRTARPTPSAVVVQAVAGSNPVAHPFS